MELKDFGPSPTEMPRETLLELVRNIQASRLVSKKRPKSKSTSQPGKIHILDCNQPGLNGLGPVLEIARCGKSRDMGKRKPRIRSVFKIKKTDFPEEYCKACVKALLKDQSNTTYPWNTLLNLFISQEA